MYDFQEIAKNIELAGTTVNQQIDKLTKQALELPEKEREFILASAREIKQAIANEDMAALLKLMNNDQGNKS